MRHDGWYATRPRGMRAKAAPSAADGPPAIVPAPRLAPTEATRRRAALLQQIFAVDPLACPSCHGTMRIVAFTTQTSVIDQILTHLRTRAAHATHAGARSVPCACRVSPVIPRTTQPATNDKDTPARRADRQDDILLRLPALRKVTCAHFFEQATLNPNSHLITGTICGYRIEDIETPRTRQVRYLDKLVDELAKGRTMEKIPRSP